VTSNTSINSVSTEQTTKTFTNMLHVISFRNGKVLARN